jgi:hypothetical protein
MANIRSSRASVGSRFAAVAVALGAVVAASAPASAQSILGSWSGNGTIVYPSGEQERARCRATFHNSGGGGVAMRAICATASLRVTQTASLAQLTSNTFSGEFYNTEYNLSGSIRVRVQGNRLNASLNGGGGSAQFSMNR